MAKKKKKLGFIPSCVFWPFSSLFAWFRFQRTEFFLWRGGSKSELGQRSNLSATQSMNWKFSKTKQRGDSLQKDKGGNRRVGPSWPTAQICCRRQWAFTCCECAVLRGDCRGHLCTHGPPETADPAALTHQNTHATKAETWPTLGLRNKQNEKFWPVLTGTN